MVAKSLDNYVNVRTHPIDLCQTRPGRTQAQTRETPTLTLTLALTSLHLHLRLHPQRRSNWCFPV